MTQIFLLPMTWFARVAKLILSNKKAKISHIKTRFSIKANIKLSSNEIFSRHMAAGSEEAEIKSPEY
jgi:hypothetical protein